MIMESSTVGKTTVSTTSTVVDDSTEISIFDAQKYFNELNLLETQKTGSTAVNGGNRVSPVDNVVVVEPSRFSAASYSIDSYSNGIYRNYMRTRSFRSAATPTTSSEASWNSQTGLLSVPPGSMAVSLRNPTDKAEKKTRTTTTISTMTTTPFSTTKWLSLRRKCPCSCKKSVQVKEKSLQTRSENQLPIPQIVLPPQTPSSSSSVDRLFHSHILRGGTNTATTSKSSMAEIRSSICTNNSFQDKKWGTQTRRRQNSRDTTRSLSSSSAMEINNDDRIKLQVLHGISANKAGTGRSTFTDQQRCGGSTTTGFTFPILNENGAPLPPPPPSSMSLSSPVIKMSLLKDPASMATSTNSIAEDPARDSLEIFRPPFHDQQSKTMLTSSSGKNSEQFIRSSDNQTHHQTFTFPASPTSRMRNNNMSINNADVDDVASDASSDLFEIESFSTQTTTTTATTTTAAHPSMFLYHCQRRDSMEEAVAAASSFQAIRRFNPNAAVMAGLYDHHPNRRTNLNDPPMMTPAVAAECYAYEPSEASIDWSVTTAEGFDRASVLNASEADYGEFLVAPPEPPAPEKSRRRPSGNGLLMSCRCEKAVSVGPGPRPVSRPVGSTSGTSASAGDHGRPVGPGITLSSSSTLAMWAVGHKL